MQTELSHGRDTISETITERDLIDERKHTVCFLTEVRRMRILWIATWNIPVNFVFSCGVPAWVSLGGAREAVTVHANKFQS